MAGFAPRLFWRISTRDEAVGTPKIDDLLNCVPSNPSHGALSWVVSCRRPMLLQESLAWPNVRRGASKHPVIHRDPEVVFLAEWLLLRPGVSRPKNNDFLEFVWFC